jgi:hypothetical protein
MTVAEPTVRVPCDARRAVGNLAADQILEHSAGEAEGARWQGSNKVTTIVPGFALRQIRDMLHGGDESPRRTLHRGRLRRESGNARRAE